MKSHGYEAAPDEVRLFEKCHGFSLIDQALLCRPATSSPVGRAGIIRHLLVNLVR